MTGRFITFEGIEGAGKSTQIEMVLKILQSENHTCLKTREPGGTPVGEAIRKIFLSHAAGPINPITEFMLLSAARSQHLNEIIMPALNQGMLVLCDRFADASLAYQGYGRGLSMSWIETTNNLITASLQPDLTLVFDLPLPLAMQRLASRTANSPDRIEKNSGDFHERVRRGYLEIAAAHPQRIKVIDAQQDPQTIHEQVMHWIRKVVAR